MVKIFVGGVSSSVTNDDLRTLFEKYGKVNECDVLKNYAFVHMEREGEANKAISGLHKRDFKGSSLTVEYATSKIRNATKIYVGNVSSKATTTDIKALFEKYGRVVECDIVKNYAFVHMARERDAMDAIAQLNDHPLEDQKLFVTLSKTNNPNKGQGPGPGGPRGGPAPPPPPQPSYFYRGRLPSTPQSSLPSYSSRSYSDRDYYERYAYDLYDRAARYAYDRAAYDRALDASEVSLSSVASALMPSSSYRDRSPISRRSSASLSQYADSYGLSQRYGLSSYSPSYSHAYSQYGLGSSYSAEDIYDRYSNGYASHSY